MENKDILKNYKLDKKNSTDDTLVFKKIVNKYPKKWSELKIKEGWYIDNDSVIKFIDEVAQDSKNENLLRTKEQAIAHKTLIRLIRIRDAYRDGWNPKWGDSNKNKYVIRLREHRWCNEIVCTLHHLFVFETEKQRDEFFINFREDLYVITELFS